MWLPDRTRVLKIRIHNQGEDPETVWAEDLGPSLLRSGARYVRIGNVPMLHGKPTYGDVIEVIEHEGDFPEWDRNGIDLDEIDSRILEDGGRWVAILEYWPSRTNGDLPSTFRKLDAAGAARDIVIEGAWAERGRGCAALAVPNSMSVEDLVTWLRSRKASLGFKLLHPQFRSP